MDGLNINFKSLVQNWPNLDGERVTYQHQLVFRVDPSNQSCFCSWIHGLVLGGPIVHLVLGWHKHLFLPNQLEPRIWIEFPGFYIQKYISYTYASRLENLLDWLRNFWTDTVTRNECTSMGGTDRWAQTDGVTQQFWHSKTCFRLVISSLNLEFSWPKIKFYSRGSKFSYLILMSHYSP